MSSSLFGLMLLSEGAAGAPSSPFEVNPGLMVWTLLSFGILFVLLWKFVLPQLLQATEAREKKIQQQLEEAERLNAEAKASIVEQQKLLGDARAQASSILAETKAISERERANAAEKARAEAEELLARARREIGAEKDRAKDELRREAVDIALAAAGKLIEQKLDAEADRKIVVSFLTSLEKRK